MTFLISSFVPTLQLIHPQSAVGFEQTAWKGRRRWALGAVKHKGNVVQEQWDWKDASGAREDEDVARKRRGGRERGGWGRGEEGVRVMS